MSGFFNPIIGVLKLIRDRVYFGPVNWIKELMAGVTHGSMSRRDWLHFGPGVLAKGLVGQVAALSGLNFLLVGTRGEHIKRLKNLILHLGKITMLISDGQDIETRQLRVDGAYSVHTNRGHRRALASIVRKIRNGLPGIKVFGISVSPSGYPLTGEINLDLNNDEIKADIANIKQGKPHSLMNCISWAYYLLRTQFDRKVKQPTIIIAMENWPDGSSNVRTLVLQFAEQVIDNPRLLASFSAWVEEKVPFPNVMIDRIIPKEDGYGGELLGQWVEQGKCGVVAEAFSEVVAGWDPKWGPTPEGLQIDWVDPSELKLVANRKYFFVNAAHFALAVFGLARGLNYIDSTMNAMPPFRSTSNARPLGCSLVLSLHEDYVSLIPLPLTFRNKEVWWKYSCDVRNRFKNQNLNDDVGRVARRPAEKVWRFLVEPLQTAMKKSGPVPNSLVATLAIALYGLGQQASIDLLTGKAGDDHYKLCKDAMDIVGASNVQEFTRLIRGNAVLAPVAQNAGIVQKLYDLVDDIRKNPAVQLDVLVASL
jgi:mannitol-1-phosphate/altronate dehydrogenase